MSLRRRGYIVEADLDDEVLGDTIEKWMAKGALKILTAMKLALGKPTKVYGGGKVDISGPHGGSNPILYLRAKRERGGGGWEFEASIGRLEKKIRYREDRDLGEVLQKVSKFVKEFQSS